MNRSYSDNTFPQAAPLKLVLYCSIEMSAKACPLVIATSPKSPARPTRYNCPSDATNTAQTFGYNVKKSLIFRKELGG